MISKTHSLACRHSTLHGYLMQHIPVHKMKSAPQCLSCVHIPCMCTHIRAQVSVCHVTRERLLKVMGITLMYIYFYHLTVASHNYDWVSNKCVSVWGTLFKDENHILWMISSWGATFSSSTLVRWQFNLGTLFVEQH